LTTIRLEISYDGAGFRGWAAQPGMRTVQGEMEAALAQILGEPVSLAVAGRTDAGVHAWRQVASFRTGAEVPDNLARRLNGVGPDDLSVLAAGPAAEGFDARRDARSRTYCYRVLLRETPSPFERGRALWWPRRLDLGAMAECAASLLSSHDFTAFTPTKSDHVRFERDVLRAEWTEEPGSIVSFWIEADAFMHNMVRILVGTMLEVGSRRRSVRELEALLEGSPREHAGDTVPAHGLYLASVAY
jgi:tRNA pseudouridine38-40 synthase